jgi:hypothetical protein
VVAAIAIVMGLPIHHRVLARARRPSAAEINAALIGDRAAGVRSVDAVARVTDAKVVLRPYTR